jgi:hypothetical protein
MREMPEVGDRVVLNDKTKFPGSIGEVVDVPGWGLTVKLDGAGNLVTARPEELERIWLEVEYEHCGTTWTSDWDCACDDECPVCGKAIEASDAKESNYQPTGAERRRLMR